MVKGHLGRHADLTLLVGIKAVAGSEANKINGLLKKAAKLASREQKRIDRPSMTEAHAIAYMYSKLCNKTGWDSKPRHTLTYVCFCLEILERHKLPKIVDILMEITEHLGDGKNAPNACLWAGKQAFEKWDKITEGC